MSDYDPSRSFPASLQSRTLLVLFLTTAAILTILAILDRSLVSDAAPLGIVNFEFAGTLLNAQNILKSWGTRGQLYAALSLGLDYLFILSYASFLGLGCFHASRLISINPLSTAGRFLAWLQPVAALLDSIENFALIKILLESQNTWWPQLSFWCAAPKFMIVGLGLLYLITAGAVLLFIKSKESLQK